MRAFRADLSISAAMLNKINRTIFFFIQDGLIARCSLIYKSRRSVFSNIIL